MPRVKVVHGRWGEVYLGGQILAEVTGIEYSIEIERVDVPQVGTRWNTFTEGIITGTGTLRMHKVFSRWEDTFLNYVATTPAQLRALRDAGVDPRPPLSLLVALDSPHAYGRETETLLDVLFWTYTGGFQLTDLVGREWPFSFEGVEPGTRIPVQ
jgi:hypothetical protein